MSVERLRGAFAVRHARTHTQSNEYICTHTYIYLNATTHTFVYVCVCEIALLAETIRGVVSSK